MSRPLITFRRRKQSKKTYHIITDHLKKAPCMDCGKCFPPEAMDFDHRPGEVKVNNISKSTTFGNWPLS